MTIITLPPDIETPLAEEARKQGTTPELLALDSLRQRFVPQSAAEAPLEESEDEGTLADFLSGYIGVLHSSEQVAGGARMSEGSGKKFAAGMVKKRQANHL